MKKKLLLTILIIILGTNPFIFAGGSKIKIRKIERSMKLIKGNLYASETEVSNQVYNYYLNELRTNSDRSKLSVCHVDSLAWEKLSEDVSSCFEYFYNYHTSNLYENYPIVNIKYEAAVEFCKWLTGKYNSYPGKKFEKVAFRLPTEKEWLLAAGEAGAKYTWGDTTLYHHKTGKALARMRFVDKSNVFLREFPAIAAPVVSFGKNKNGLYNISGNVAEMLSDKGKAKGGSWYDYPKNAILDKVQSYDGADPRIGFRLFMEVLE